MNKFKSIKRQIPGGFFAEGEHLTVIESATLDMARQTKEFSDRTPQVKITYRNDKGVLSHWYNTKGFIKLNKEENPNMEAPKGFAYVQATDDNGVGVGEFYLTDIKSRTRVEDKDATAVALEIFGGVAGDAGIPEGEDFGIEDLTGKSIGIKVRNRADGRGPEVQYTMVASKVKSEELAD